ncbi:hypothetical protein [Noviherbaspirillum autotrophicum]|uniref:hypothetical protein n=1 Tax=Noviherbaspirillum autotrophicum TaxID=709839 RepID=UPI0012FDD92C|nr:hypothetical protein [Noviherbaspirillum autotrophicum]
MATVRLKTKEVQVDSVIYCFDAVWKADAFEAYLAVADVEHCVKEHQPVEMRRMERDPPPVTVIDGGHSAQEEA